MGKHGPCYHCGVTSTPLWRNGPPDKPVLCNACGSRWRTKGSLTNYTPLHARAPIENLEEFKFSKEKSTVFKNKEQKLLKVTESNDHVHGKRDMVDCDQNFHRVYDEDISNRSSSGSAVSYSESCAHFGNADVSDATGSLQSNVWESLVPSKKRTGVTRPKPSSVEKLTKDLHFILHQQPSHLSGISEEELLYENNTPNGSVEICNGGVLIRQSNLSTLEEESEASSLLVENKSIYSELPLPVHVHSQGPSFSYNRKEKLRKVCAENELGKRDGSQDNFHVLRKRDSQLGFVDLKEVVNLEGFMNYFTDEEQQQLLKLLPSSDTAHVPESLRSMFTCTQFRDTLTCFQMLLQQGIFDLSVPGANDDECRSLKSHALLDLRKHKWVEYSKMLKDTIHGRNSGEQNVAGEADLGCSSKLASVKRPHDHDDGQNSNFQGMNFMIKNPRKVCKTGAVGPISMKSPKPEPTEVETKSTNATNEHVDSDGSCFSPRSLFAYNSGRSSMLDPMHVNIGKPDQDLLLDIRSNSSFPEAELLSNIWKVKDVPNSSIESAVSEKEDGLSCYPSSSSSSKQPPGIIHA